MYVFIYLGPILWHYQ